MRQTSANFAQLAQFSLELGGDASFSVEAFLDALARDGIEAYVCGGAVRDVLLGRPFNDVDFVCKLPIEALDAWLQARYGADAVSFRSHGFGLVKLGPAQAVDVTMFRSADSVGGAASLGEVCYDLGDSLLDDARNRDLSINCLYWNPAAGVVDPLGHGVADVLGRQLRVVADPRKAAIDPRITFRLMAFEARGYALTPEAIDYLHATLDRDVAMQSEASLPAYLATLTRGDAAAAKRIVELVGVYGSAHSRALIGAAMATAGLAAD